MDGDRAPPEAPASAPGGGVVDRGAAARRIRRARRLDRFARLAITAGGILIILAVLGIFVFVFAEAAPLFFPARMTERAEAKGGPGRTLSCGEDEYREWTWILSDDGKVRFAAQGPPAAAREFSLEGRGAARIVSGARSPDGGIVAAGTSDGRALLGRILFEPAFADGRRVRGKPELETLPEAALSRGGRPVSLLAAASAEGKAFVAGAGDGFLAVARVPAGGIGRPMVFDASESLQGLVPTAVALEESGRRLVVGTSAGRLLVFPLENGEPGPARIVVTGTRPVTALAFAYGGETILAGDDRGAVEGLQGIRPGKNAQREFRRVRAFPDAPAAVLGISPSRRDKSFLVWDASGGIRVDHSTTERTVASLPAAGSPVAAAALSPRKDGGMAVLADGRIRRFDLSAPHSEVTFRSLFLPVLYEGADEPALVWQTSAASADVEPKFSLVPLIFGSFKGVLYAMIFSAPLALLAALYTSQFASPKLRGIVKPVVEIMAALPSVVVGFLAGLWLSPLAEKNLPAIAAGFVLLPASVALAAGVLWLLPKAARGRIVPGREIPFVLPFLALGVLASAALAAPLEGLLFGGDLKAWVREVLGLRFDPRNALVVGFALGFAVIPILYTVAEDAFSNVPRSLLAASEALGASRWQTAWRVALPAASPGIFAAVMLAFGRAIGETMIVVMATGNTPILSMSPFDGMRTISAAIAVEMPEAPVGGTLFRVLFLAGSILFVFTFLCNTAAEAVKMRLRRRFGKW